MTSSCIFVIIPNNHITVIHRLDLRLHELLVQVDRKDGISVPPGVVLCAIGLANGDDQRFHQRTGPSSNATANGAQHLRDQIAAPGTGSRWNLK